MKNFMFFLYIVMFANACNVKQRANSLIPRNGFYEVKGFDSLQPQQALLSSEMVLQLDSLFHKNDRRTVIIDTTDYVPLELAAEPLTEKQSDAKIFLSIRLNNVATEKMKRFTATRVMKQVAIVIGAKVITIHKLREAITGPGVQITRCDDKACEYLLLKLKE